MLASPQTSFGEKWMRDERTPKDVCGEATAPGRGTLEISGWGCATGTLEPLTYTRASWAEFCHPILE